MSKRRKNRQPQTKVAVVGAASQLPQAHYDAAGTGRRMRGWMPSSSGPNRSIAGQPTLRNRARDAARNDWAGRAIPARWSANLIGTGIIARPKTSDPATKERLTNLWNEWLSVCDADGVLDGYGLQNMVAANWIAAGEVFVRLRYRRPEDGLPVPLQLQILESEMVPMHDGFAANGNKIMQGIEFNAIGQRVAYWMYRTHPGEANATGELVRVLAKDVLHIYEPLRPGQLRGVSELAPILAKLRGVGDFDDAVLERQKLANLFTGFVERQPVAVEPSIDPISGRKVERDNADVPMVAMEPGTFQELLPGESVKFSEPPDAGANYGDFTRTQYLGVSAGTGLPYEILTGDLREISDRSLRVIINEFRRMCQQRQWLILIPQFCQKVRNAWAESAVISGALPGKLLNEAKRVTWIPQGWPYIHPTQDVAAQKTAVEAGLTSRTRIINERGDDPEEIDRERLADQERELAAGLRLPAPDPNAPPNPVDQAKARLIEAETRLLKAQEDIARNAAEDQRHIAAAEAEFKKAEARRAQEEQQLAQARRQLVDAEVAVIQAKAEGEKAEQARAQIAAELCQAQTERESNARIEVLQQQAQTAELESQARQEALAAAERHAEEIRSLIWQTEQARLTTAQLEVEAARIGLDELKELSA
ncbi:MAG: Phage portal protein, lambda family [Betaproteobacteria bacterium ADurb.Bin341]|nr:MAG: Phage portal protein, lambda family [Betaproteobacteria bacterium ADurb.Bin341]